MDRKQENTNARAEKYESMSFTETSIVKDIKAAAKRLTTLSIGLELRVNCTYAHAAAAAAALKTNSVMRANYYTV